MKLTYTVNPPHHQPQWPVEDEKPMTTLLDNAVFYLGICFFVSILLSLVLLGLFSMTVEP